MFNSNNKDLNAWNRCAYAFNIITDLGIDAMKKYTSTLPLEEKKEMLDMFKRIKKDGYAVVKKQVIATVGK